MSKRSMYLRIKESEIDLLREAHQKINNELLKNGHPALKDSEILHRILELGIPRIRTDKLGRFYLDN